MNIRRRGSLFKSGAVSALTLFFSLAPLSAGGPGSAGLQVLKNDFSPRAMGMGGAFAAVADDSYAMNYNPAGLGQLYMPEASVMYLSGFEDSTLNNFAVAMPLPLRGFAGLAKPSMGLSLMMADAGSFVERQEDAFGNVTTNSAIDAQKDSVLTLGYGEKIYSEDIKISGREFKVDQYLGVNFKYIRSTMLENYSASCIAFDAGWLGMEPKLGLAAGASFSNSGGGLKYVSETTKLPSILRLGLSYQRPTVMDQSLLLAAEGDFYTAESVKSLRFGMEYHFEKIFNLRLGYKAAEDNGGLTLGLGIHIGDMSMDFATGSGSEVYNTAQASLSYKFSGITIRERSKKNYYKDPEPRNKPQQRPGQPKPQRKPEAPQEKQEKKDNSDFFWLY